MNQQIAHSGIVPQAWLQHHVPWLGLLAMLMGLFRDDGDMGFDPDERNG